RKIDAIAHQRRLGADQAIREVLDDRVRSSLIGWPVSAAAGEAELEPRSGLQGATSFCGRYRSISERDLDRGTVRAAIQALWRVALPIRHQRQADRLTVHDLNFDILAQAAAEGPGSSGVAPILLSPYDQGRHSLQRLDAAGAGVRRERST